VVDVLKLERSHGAIGFPLHEHEIEDPDDTTVDEVEQCGESFVRHLIAGEFDDQITDWAEGARFVCHRLATFRVSGDLETEGTPMRLLSSRHRHPPSVSQLLPLPRLATTKECSGDLLC